MAQFDSAEEIEISDVQVEKIELDNIIRNTVEFTLKGLGIR